MRSSRANLLRSALSAVAVATLVVACQETPVELPTATTLNTNVATLAMTAGDNAITVSAAVLDATGRPMSPQPQVIWSSSAPDIATVSTGGTVAAIAAGSANITATSGSLSAAVAVTVTNPVLELSPASIQLLPNTSITLTSVLRDASGRALAAQQNATFEILDRTVASIGTALGTQTAVTASVEGTTRVVARVGNLTDTTVVQVLRNANDLVTAINILPDSIGGLTQPSIFPLLNASDPALRFSWTATNAAGADRCSTVRLSGVVVLTSRNTSVIGNPTLQTLNFTCEITLPAPTFPGVTWVVMQVNNLLDSVRVVVRPNIASISIIPDSVVFEQSTVADQQPLLAYRVLTPRGTNICASVQAQLAIVARNVAVGSLTQLAVPVGETECNVRVLAGNANTDGAAYALIVATNSGAGTTVRDSVRLRQGTALYRFADPTDATQGLSQVGNVVLGDTLRAGESRTISIRVLDRASAPVAGATVQIVATVNGGAEVGSFNTTSVTTAANGVASFIYTAPQVLNSNGSAAATTQDVTFTLSGVAGNGAGIANGSATVNATPAIFPRAASRLVVFRRNLITAADTTNQVAAVTIPITSADRWQYRAFDTFGNPIILVGAAPASAAQQRITTLLSRPDQANITGANIDGTDWQLTAAMAGDTSTVTASVGAATAAVALTGGARPNGVFVNVTTLSRRTTPFNNVAALGTLAFYALAPAQATINITTHALTGHPDTAVVSANLAGSGFRAYIRPMDGSQAAVAWSIANALGHPLSTGPTGTGGRPFNQIAFVPSTSNRGAAYFITDSVSAGPALSRILVLEPSGTITNCVANANPYTVFSGIAISPSGTEAIVTTRHLADGDFATPLRGTAADSTQFSQVWRMTLPGCALTQLTSTTSANVEFRRPIWISATAAVVERYDQTNTHLHSITTSGVSGSLLFLNGDAFLAASADLTRADGVIWNNAGLRFGLMPNPVGTLYNIAPVLTLNSPAIFSRR